MTGVAALEMRAAVILDAIERRKGVREALAEAEVAFTAGRGEDGRAALVRADLLRADLARLDA